MQALLARLRAHLVDDWKNAWRWASIRVHLVATAFLAVYALVPSVPAEVAAIIPPAYRGLLIAAWAIAGIAARLLQKKPNG